MGAQFLTQVLENRIEVLFAPQALVADHLDAVREVAALLRQRAGFGVLIDLTQQAAALSWSDERAIADHLKNAARALGGGVALVARPGVQYGVARVQQALAEPDVELAVFTARDEAIDWLEARWRGAKGG